MLVSIIIPAYNEESDIKDVLESIKKQNYPKENIETIVIDDKSTDRTAEIARNYDVKVIKGQHKGVGAARNLGIKKSKGEIILFVDADQVLDKNYVKEITKPFKDKNVGGVTGLELLWNNKNIIAKLSYLKKRLGYETSSLVPLGAVRKKIIQEVGYIDPKFGMYDDWEFAKRVSEKYKIVRNRKAIFYHKEPTNIKKIYRQCRWTAKSTLMLYSKKEFQKALRNSIFVLINGLLPLYIIFLFSKSIISVFGFIGIILFLTLEFWRSYQIFKITKWKVAWLTPFYDAIYMMIVLIGILDILIKRDFNFGV